MGWGSGCLIAIGVVFVLFGGCTTFFWSMEFAHPDPGFSEGAGILLAIGVVILLGGIAMIAATIRAIRRRRAAGP